VTTTNEVNVAFPFAFSLDEGRSVPSGTDGTESGTDTELRLRVLGTMVQDGAGLDVVLTVTVDSEKRISP
jgi:hypothetical protein